MHKKAIIFDLDNTIYPVKSIGPALFDSLFKLVKSDEGHVAEIEHIKADLMRRPFQVVAVDYQFSEVLVAKATHLLKHLAYDHPIEPYSDYHFTKSLHIDKFLVTTGFKKLQQSKIDRLDIGKDFNEIHIIDPSESTATKKDVFADIMQRHHFQTTEVIVVGDDLESEIRAAIDLDIEALLYDRDDTHNHARIKKIKSMSELNDYT